MTMIVNPYAGGGGGGGSGGIVPDYTLVSRNSSMSSGTGATDFQDEIQDDFGAFNIGTSASQLVVQATAGYVRPIGQMVDGAVATRIDKNGSTFNGCVRIPAHTDAAWHSLPAAIVPGVATEAFTLVRETSSSPDAYTWFGLEDIPHDFCSARLNATQGITSSLSDIAFDTSLHETVSIHSAGVFTIPVDAVFIRGAASIRGSTTSSSSRASIMDVGMTIDNVVERGCLFASCTRPGSAHQSICGASAIIPVSGGEEVRFQAAANQSQNIGANAETWGQVEILPDTVEFITAFLDTTHNVTTSFTVIGWDGELHKTQSGFHDNSTNNSRLINPAGSGFTRCRVSFGVWIFDGATTQISVRATVNGSEAPGLPRNRNTDDCGMAGFGQWAAIAEGDYIEIEIMGSGAFTLSDDNRTWVCVEFA